MTSTSRKGFNYYTPEFRQFGANTTIDNIQLDSSLGAMEANLQLIGAGGASAAYYNWFDGATAAEFGYTDGKSGCWVTDDLELPDPAVILKPGDGVQLDLAADKGVTSAGEVDDSDVVYTTRKGFNFVGNAYPTSLNIQDVQLDDSLGAMEANLQLIGAGGASAAYYNWFDPTTAGEFGYTDGKKGCWVTDDLELPDPAVILNPGESVQIDTAADKTVTVLSPIEI